jgi:isopentenyl-diphosphate delta-isomerase
MRQRTVTLVDERNHAIGVEELVAAHTGDGKLHRAFSVYVFRHAGREILIQKRSVRKMLWPCIWANTCCSHPFDGENAVAAGKRRLHEELGFSCDLKPACTFVYRAEDPAGRGVEHEHVTVLVGVADEAVAVCANPDEVEEWRWADVDELRRAMNDTPADYAPWFHLGMKGIERLRP